MVCVQMFAPLTYAAAAVCVVQAQLHFPQANMQPIAKFLDALGVEFARRMRCSGALEGLPALALLNELLFGAPHPEGCARIALELTHLQGSVPDAWPHACTAHTCAWVMGDVLK